MRKAVINILRHARNEMKGIAILALLLLSLSSTVIAQEQHPTEAQAQTTVLMERVGVNATAQKPLTLFDAIALALENNKDINAARIDANIARFGLQGALGAFDPRLSTENSYQRQISPVASLIGGGVDGKLTQANFVNRASLSGASPTLGSTYQIDFTSSRQTTNNSFISLNPQFPSALNFSLTQPLWRGLRTDNNRRSIAIARKNLSLSDSQFRQRAIETITRVQQSYWDLTFALKNLEVQLDAVKQARAQVESNKRQVDQGLLAPIDLVSAETQVATFEQNVYSAQETVTRAENALKSLLLPNRNAPLWSQAIQPGCCQCAQKQTGA
jgi:outer membrane protein TolC